MGMNRKAAVSLLLIAVMGLFAVACGGGGSDSSGTSEEASGGGGGSVTIDLGEGQSVEAEKGKQLKVGLFLAGTVTRYMQAFDSGVHAAADEFGYDVETFDPAFDPTKQFNQMQTSLTTNPDIDAAIAVPLNPDQACKLLSETAPASEVVVVVSVNAICGRGGNAPEEMWQPGTLAFNDADNTIPYREGWLRAIGERLTKPTKIALFLGPPLIQDTIAIEGALKAVEPEFPDMEIVTKLRTDYTTPDALAQTQTMLRANPDIEGIISPYSDTTSGILTALEEEGKAGKVKVFDIGASKFALQAIKEGKVELTVPFTPYTAGYEAMTALHEAFEGEQPERLLPGLKYGSIEEPLIITKSNLDAAEPQF